MCVGSVPPHVTYIHMDFWTVFYSVYLLDIDAVVAVQAGQLTDPEYRAIPSLVAVAGMAGAMAGGIPVIPQFHPHEEVSDPDDSPVFSFCSVCTGIFRVFSSVRFSVADPDPGSRIWCLFDSGIRDGKIRTRDGKNSDPG